MPRPDRGPHDVPWFLRAGRAGLAPESVTVDGDPGVAPGPAADPITESGTDVAGSPPWAAESADQDLDAPPPWESGPWPSHGPTEVEVDLLNPGDWPASRNEPTAGPAVSPVGVGSAGAGSAGVGPADAGSAGVEDDDAPGSYRPQSSRPQSSRPQSSRPQSFDRWAAAPPANRVATGAVVAGIAGILVVPGVVLGILGLRRARATGTGLVQSWLGIALSLVWAAGIIVVVSLPGQKPSSADPGCMAYQAGGAAAAARVSAALSAGAPARRLATELRQAADTVNSAAARAQGLTVRSALSAMTGDLQAALGEITAGRPVPQAVKTSLGSDTAAAATMCGGAVS